MTRLATPWLALVGAGLLVLLVLGRSAGGDDDRSHRPSALQSAQGPLSEPFQGLSFDDMSEAHREMAFEMLRRGLSYT